jgi:hypothetical protein
MNKCKSKNPSACRFHGSGGVTKEQVDKAYKKASDALSILVEQTHYRRVPAEVKSMMESDYHNALEEAHKINLKYDTTAEGFSVLEKFLSTRGFPQSTLDSEGDKIAARYFYAKQIRDEESTYDPNPIAGTKYSERELCVEYDIPKKYLDKMLYKPPAGLVNSKEKPSQELVAARIETIVAKYNYSKAKEAQDTLFSSKSKNVEKLYNKMQDCINKEQDLYYIHLSAKERQLLETIKERNIKQ